MNRYVSLPSVAIVAASAALAALGGVAAAMWLDKGPQIYLSLIESGLAWCL